MSPFTRSDSRMQAFDTRVSLVRAEIRSKHEQCRRPGKVSEKDLEGLLQDLPLGFKAC